MVSLMSGLKMKGSSITGTLYIKHVYQRPQGLSIITLGHGPYSQVVFIYRFNNIQNIYIVLLVYLYSSTKYYCMVFIGRWSFSVYMYIQVLSRENQEVAKWVMLYFRIQPSKVVFQTDTLRFNVKFGFDAVRHWTAASHALSSIWLHNVCSIL